MITIFVRHGIFQLLKNLMVFSNCQNFPSKFKARQTREDDKVIQDNIKIVIVMEIL